MRVLTVIGSQNFNAGPKAPRDIIEILKKEYGAKSVEFVQSNNIIKKIMYRIKIIYNILISKINNEILVFQFPFYETSNILNKLFLFSLKRANKDKTIVLIHDLEGLRNNDDKIKKQDVSRLNMIKYVIAHNKIMKEYLENEGVTSKIYTLDLFDYLCEENNDNDDKKESSEDSIVYAGNLIKIKSPFIYQVDESKMNFKLNLYGVGLEENKLDNKKIIYKGKFPPDELPNKLNGKLGLIWDGEYDESDENQGLKRYTKYNNPHKLSCYIASGLPVIVWEKAACANFVKENNIGYTINSIYNINTIQFSEFDEKKKSVLEMQKKVREGYFTKKVFREIIQEMKG